jgi:hypothetical protein
LLPNGVGARFSMDMSTFIVVAEIWFIDDLIAEINQENDELEMVFYEVKGLSVNFKEYLEVLESAKSRLIGLK